ncbi:MAG TPA: recombinase family protein [Streptosporangiaceae bacterium]|nr:recombinase family protein [Streptosporangiaceae bacterium]
MSDPKVTAAHLRRAAAVYCRQSTLVQVERNRESTLRQYDLASRAGALGWPRSAVRVIDADLGVSGSGLAARAGFTELTEQIALGQVGVVLALEVSRLARSSAEWYRLLDLCGITDTLIADETSVYHPGMFDDRLILGLKGTMAESELQVLRARMLGGLRNKAARGELRIALPAGLVWGEEPGQVLLHPDEAVRGAITAVFGRFAVSGSARQTWLWLRENGLKLPSLRDGQLAWVTAAYPAVHKILTHPAYAGAYVYGRTRAERYIDASGTPAGKRRAVPRPADWQVLITGHHPGYIDWDTYLANTARLAANMAPVRGAGGTGATREGCALLQGLAVCGICGRRLGVFYRGTAKSAPGYQCNGGVLVGGGQGRRCTRVSGVRIDPAVAGHVLETLTPLALQAALDAADQIEAGHDAALDQWRRQAEQARYAATRAERRYRAVDPENRLVARGLEAEWEASLQAVRDAEAELERRQAARPVRLSADERAGILAIATDLPALWDAPSTADRDRKELLHALLDDVVVTADDISRTARLVLHWKGGLTSELTADLPRPNPPCRTSEDTVSLIARLAAHYDDSMITKVLNQQKRRTATGISFTPANVATIRKRHGIPPYQGGNAPDPDGEVMSVHQAAAELGITASTLYRWLNDGIVPGEQITPGAPWRIRLTPSIRELVADNAPAGWVPVQVATAALGVSRQTVLQRVKRGGLRAVHIRTGRRKGLRIELPTPQEGLF